MKKKNDLSFIIQEIFLNKNLIAISIIISIIIVILGILHITFTLLSGQPPVQWRFFFAASAPCGESSFSFVVPKNMLESPISHPE